MPRGRPPTVGATETTGFRLPADLISQIKLYRERLEAERPGEKVSLAAAVRILLRKALAEDAPAPDRKGKRP